MNHFKDANLIVLKLQFADYPGGSSRGFIPGVHPGGYPGGSLIDLSAAGRKLRRPVGVP